MKTFLLLVLAMLGLVATSTQSFAAPNPAFSTRIVHDNYTLYTSLGAEKWYTIMASTPKAVKGIVVANSGTVGIQVGAGASGSEVVVLEVPKGPSTTVGPGMAYIPVSISQSQKIAVKPHGSTGAVGELDITLVYY